MTKAVSDAFGKGGIADQAMRFNGYPSLEKEDPTIHVPGVQFVSIRVTDQLMLDRSITSNEDENCSRAR